MKTAWNIWVIIGLLSLGYNLWSKHFASNGASDKSKRSSFVKRVSSNLYKNDFLDFSVRLPSGWEADSYQVQKKHNEAGNELFVGDDKKLKRKIERSEDNTYDLFSFYKSMKSGETWSANCNAFAEKIPLGRRVKSGEDFFKILKGLLQQGQVQFKFDTKYGNRNLGGKEFDTLKAILTINGVKTRQKYSCRIEDDYAIVIIQNYRTKNDYRETEKVLKSIKFKKA